MSLKDKRSPEAKKRRAPARAKAIAASGRRVACEVCHLLHKPPACPEGAESVAFCVMLPPHVHRELKARVEFGERSPWVVRLIRKALDV